MEKYRALTQQEIDILIKQQCSSDNWKNIRVKEGFSTDYIHNVHFSGNTKLGLFEKEFTLDGGLKRHSGIYQASLHNCDIQDNVFIKNINNYIANYVIKENSFIENTNLIAVTEKTSFGNGTKISVLNEGGGREILIADKLSSNLAYIMALYRHREKTINQIEKIIKSYSESINSTIGTIGKNVTITNCGIIKNTKIGNFAILNGVSKLTNGSINSNENDPAFVGENVIANNFIVSSGAKITEGALLENCFIGQASLVGKNFSIYDSVLFCNSQAFHGEACAIFGGPFTVSHHKSTLLIGGMFSFFNAGSGSNQSNHMYKLGPVHQGIIERGSKATSNSYIMWPAKIGAFSLVMGRHYNNCDSSNFPFSYLVENNKETYIIPGIALQRVGTIRDAQKWGKRDNRKDKNLLDQINLELFTPYTIGKIYEGLNILKSIQRESKETAGIYNYQKAKIKESALSNGIKYYETAIIQYIGNSISKRFQENAFSTIQDFHTVLGTGTEKGKGDWVDISGLIAPKSEIDSLMDYIDNKTINNIDAINDHLFTINKTYDAYQWTWTCDKLEKLLAKKIDEILPSDITSVLEKWIESITELQKLLYNDAKKEFDVNAQIGFGTDGNEDEKKADFINVRGHLEENPFIKYLKNDTLEKTSLAKELINRISLIKC